MHSKEAAVPSLVMQHFVWDLLEELLDYTNGEQIHVILAIEKNSKCYSTYIYTHTETLDRYV